MGMSLGFYSFIDCLPPDKTFVYIIDANVSKTEIKRTQVDIQKNPDTNEVDGVYIFNPEEYTYHYYGLNTPNINTNLLYNIYWISEKDFHNSFLT